MPLLIFPVRQAEALTCPGHATRAEFFASHVKSAAHVFIGDVIGREDARKSFPDTPLKYSWVYGVIVTESLKGDARGFVKVHALSDGDVAQISGGPRSGLVLNSYSPVLFVTDKHHRAWSLCGAATTQGAYYQESLAHVRAALAQLPSAEDASDAAVARGVLGVAVAMVFVLLLTGAVRLGTRTHL